MDAFTLNSVFILNLVLRCDSCAVNYNNNIVATRSQIKVTKISMESLLPHGKSRARSMSRKPARIGKCHLQGKEKGRRRPGSVRVHFTTAPYP